MQKCWRKGAVGERVVWQAAVRHPQEYLPSTRSHLGNAASELIGLPSPTKQIDDSLWPQSRTDRRLGVAVWPPPSGVFTPRLESTLTNSLATDSKHPHQRIATDS